MAHRTRALHEQRPPGFREAIDYCAFQVKSATNTLEAASLMNRKLQAEIKRMQDILSRHRQDFVRAKPVTARAIASIERRTGLVFDHLVREFFTFSNGSRSRYWAAVMSDQIQPLVFPPLESAYKAWSIHSPYDQSLYDEWNDPHAKRDPQIQPAYIRHKLWFPLAEFNGGTTSLLYDCDPTRKGRFGQILVYQHDPDAIYYVAATFLGFLEKSNDLLEANASDLLTPVEVVDDPWRACENSDLGRVKHFLAQGISVNSRNQDGRSLLRWRPFMEIQV